MTEFNAGDLRFASAVMLAGAVVLPLLPGEPGFACPLRTLTGVPCPLCGMTTSVEHLVRFDVVGALAANPGGVGVVLLALVALAFRPTRIRLPAIVLSGVLVTMWVFELHRFAVI